MDNYPGNEPLAPSLEGSSCGRLKGQIQQTAQTIQTALGPKCTPVGLHERNSTRQRCRPTSPRAWGKLFGLPPFPRL